MFKLAYIIASLITLDARIIPNKYNEERQALLDEETLTAVGGKVHLNTNETIANDILMRWKMKELNATHNNPQYFNYSKHYFSYKKDLEYSKVYQIIKKMPKGAALHLHNTLLLHADVMVQFTYEDHLYACHEHDAMVFHFSETAPDLPCLTEWSLVSHLRNSSGNVEAFDIQLKNYFTMYRENGEDYKSVDINTVWKRFRKVSRAIGSFISYRPIREKYWYETLKQFYNDNVMYIEIRSGVYSLYELNGTKHDKKYLMDLIKNVTNQFIADHPDFIGVKVIIAQSRARNADQVLEVLNMTRRLKAEMPDFIAGFDLVGQEDKGKPLTEFLPVLSEAKDEINFYLHAGETVWQGTSADENLIDAILLGSKRIGHGYALTKHPRLMTAVIQKDIALEVNVISNAVLALVQDVRNHPLASYLAMGLPVVLSSDDPGAWSAKPLTDDFFVAFMGIASQHADLRLLKQLALNSITYSSLECERKERLLNVFNTRWDKFVGDVISDPLLADKHDLIDT